MKGIQRSRVCRRVAPRILWFIHPETPANGGGARLQGAQGDGKSPASGGGSKPPPAHRAKRVYSGGIADPFLDVLQGSIQDGPWVSESANDPTWYHIFTHLLARALRLPKDGLQWGTVFHVLETLANAGIDLDKAQLGQIASLAGNDQKAVQLWESAGKISGEDYLRAKSKVVGFPKNLIMFGQLKDYPRVLQEWEDHKNLLPNLSELDSETQHAIVDAALTENQLGLAITMVEPSLDQERLRKLAKAATDIRDVEAAATIAVLVLRLLVRNRKWDAAIRAGENLDFSGWQRGQLEFEQLLRQNDKSDQVFRGLVYSLAKSEELSAEAVDKQDSVLEFLVRYFVKRSRSVRALLVPVQVAGVAIERTGKFVDAIQYYENLESDSTRQQAERLFAAGRLVRKLEDFAAYLRKSKDSPTEQLRAERDAQDRISRAQALRKKYNLGNEPMPEYAKIRIDSIESESQSKWTRGDFSIEVGREIERVSIRKNTTMEWALLDARKQELRAIAECKEEKSLEGELRVWRISDWGMRICLFREEGKFRIQLEFSGETLNIAI